MSENKLSLLDHGLELTQPNGDPPELITAGSAAGESGLHLAQVNFADGAHYSSATRHHLLFFHLSSPARVDCRVAGEVYVHEAKPGVIGICPAGADTLCKSECPVENLVVAIDPAALTLAAAEEDVLGPRVTERLSGEDHELCRIAEQLAAECAAGFPNGALYWNDAAACFISTFLMRHTTANTIGPRSVLSERVLAQIRDFINANLDAPIDVDALARIAGLSPFHFSRAFARSVGITPHRYVMRTRLKRARELLREGRFGFAHVAAETGFADQSHLSRWIRRVHGATMRQLAAQTSSH